MTQQELEQTVLILKGRLDAFELTDRFAISKTFQLMDGRNIQLGRGTGTKIGTATDQKLGFFGHAPVSQQANIAPISGGATIDTQARTGVNSIITALDNLGFTA